MVLYGPNGGDAVVRVKSTCEQSTSCTIAQQQIWCPVPGRWTAETDGWRGKNMTTPIEYDFDSVVVG